MYAATLHLRYISADSGAIGGAGNVENAPTTVELVEQSATTPSSRRLEEATLPQNHDTAKPMVTSRARVRPQILGRVRSQLTAASPVDETFRN